MSVDFTCDEKDRFSSRLATIPGLRPLPSVGDWLLLEVQKPQELARKVNPPPHPATPTPPRGLGRALPAPRGRPG